MTEELNGNFTTPEIFILVSKLSQKVAYSALVSSDFATFQAISLACHSVLRNLSLSLVKTIEGFFTLKYFPFILLTDFHISSAQSQAPS